MNTAPQTQAIAALVAQLRKHGSKIFACPGGEVDKLNADLRQAADALESLAGKGRKTT